MNPLLLPLSMLLAAAPGATIELTACPSKDIIAAQKLAAENALEFDAAPHKSVAEAEKATADAKIQKEIYQSLEAYAQICQTRAAAVAGEAVRAKEESNRFKAVVVTSEFTRFAQSSKGQASALTVLLCVHEQGQAESLAVIQEETLLSGSSVANPERLATERGRLNRHEQMASAYRAELKKRNLSRTSSCNAAGMRTKIECAMGLGDDECLAGELGMTLALAELLKVKDETR